MFNNALYISHLYNIYKYIYVLICNSLVCTFKFADPVYMILGFTYNADSK
uniref:Uncharacterized protein n=1 Tax=uncultured Desulfobacterium sp. TaxID=201089 RepID=E1YGK1_9BACT|nr:unknown protein [uncultured Desulfobacterium sp.]